MTKEGHTTFMLTLLKFDAIEVNIYSTYQVKTVYWQPLLAAMQGFGDTLQASCGALQDPKHQIFGFGGLF